MVGGAVLGWVERVAGAVAQFAAETSGEDLRQPGDDQPRRMTERNEQLTLWLPRPPTRSPSTPAAGRHTCAVRNGGSDGDLEQLELPFDGGIECKGGLRPTASTGPA